MEYQQQSNLQLVPVASVDFDDNNEAPPPGISVSKFDFSVDDHFKVMDKIAMISGESEFEYEENEIQRLCSSVTFLRKWRDLFFEPRAIRFACEDENSQKNNVTSEFNLPQFSSATVPKDMTDENGISSPLSKDFVMNVGGHVWALDWCPKVHQSSNFDTNVEFIAVSAHPPESSYHKIGDPLTGRGLIQIWCILNTGLKDQEMTNSVKVKPKKYTKNNKTTEIKDDQPKKPRGRPRKYPVNESVSKMDCNGQSSQNLGGQTCEKSNDLRQLVVVEENDKNMGSSKPKRPRGRPRKNPVNENDEFLQNCACQTSEKSTGRTKKKQIDKSVPEVINISPKTSPQPIAFAFPEVSREMLDVDKITFMPPESVDEKLTFSERVNTHFQAVSDKSLEEEALKSTPTSSKSKLEKCQTRKKSKVNYAVYADCESSLQPDPVDPEYSEKSTKSKLKKCQTRRKGQGNNSVEQDPAFSEPGHDSGPVSEDVGLPRLVLGLAHNGKVCWDVKWRPFDSNVVSKHFMGCLAVLLGNGALEVWNIPLPSATKAIYSSSQNEGNDPRFIKLKPVFRCSMLKCGDRQSIPITLEWSTSTPHDLILAGCHDGVVAVWKFSDNDPSKDTRPLLCFNGDTVPIRAVKWAPASDPESANIVVTAGHKGLKFWDIRDPFRPLWDLPSQKIIYSLDWVPDPKCVVLCSDDGEIRIMSLSKAANDVPVTGMPNVKTQQYGLNSYYCSSSPIWSIQVSLTGMVAYCCSDGKVIHFQLTTKAVEKDPHRNRAPHYLCGSLIGEESSLTILSCLPNVPFLMKKSSNEWSNTPISKRGFISTANQEKRAKDQNSKSQKSQKLPLNDTSQNTQTSQAIVCIGDSKSQKEEEEKDKKCEEERRGFPPKIVAMHRVRWNMNKGSEKLLCYGGAAGIIRCQIIS